MKSRASHHPYRTICTAIACLLTLSIEQIATGQAAQQDQSPNSLEKCPTIAVSCPFDLGYAKPLTFTASVDGLAPAALDYVWAVSAGTILEGQGTATIKVDMSSMGGQAITATVTIYGLPKSCHTQASCSLIPGVPPSPAVLFDTYYPKAIGAAAPKRTRRRRKTIRLH